MVFNVLNNATLTKDQIKILSRISIDESSGCWTWTSTRHGTRYGVVSIAGQRVLAHRAAWEAFRGAIPPGLEVDHLCRRTLCVNPDHLEPVTKAENIARYQAYVTTTPMGASRKRVLELHNKGFTPRQIAKVMDLSAQRVYQQLKKLEVKPNQPQPGKAS